MDLYFEKYFMYSKMYNLKYKKYILNYVIQNKERIVHSEIFYF